ncbi:MAG TPA: hypothetical protein EYH38_03655 [Leucothrix sp.]|nr:hypothetical protein [Leucothrix sp.]
MNEEVSTINNNENSQKTIATIVYLLQAVSFLLSFTYIIAVIVNYVKKTDVAGTWLESHFKWQIRTFWYSILWSILGLISIYFIIGIPILIANTIWVIYRIIKGWLRLNDGKKMYSK